MTNRNDHVNHIGIFPYVLKTLRGSSGRSDQSLSKQVCSHAFEVNEKDLVRFLKHQPLVTFRQVLAGVVTFWLLSADFQSFSRVSSGS